MSKITFITLGLGVGGAQKILVFAANQVVAAGHDVNIVSIKDRKEGLFIDKRINVVELHQPYPTFIGNIVRKLFKAFIVALKIRKAIKACKTEVAVVFIYDLIRISYVALFGLKIKKVACERDNPYDFSNKQLKKIDWLYNQYDHVIFQLTRARDIFSSSIINKSTIIPNPCIPRIKKIPVFEGQRKKVFIVAARLEAIKNIDLLIHAFSKVHHKYNEYKLHIYGTGSQHNKLARLIKSYNLEDVVILKGLVLDVFLLESDCYGLLLSSNAEGIPNVLLEAMSIGIPCIATDCEPGGPRMLLKDNKGLLVPVGDINKMTNAICKYIEHPNIASQFGENGKAVSQLFEPLHIGKQWVTVINNMVKTDKKMCVDEGIDK